LKRKHYRHIKNDSPNQSGIVHHPGSHAQHTHPHTEERSAIRGEKLLSDCKPGEEVKVSLVHGGPGMRAHLSGLGIYKDSHIGVIKKGKPGPFLLNVKNSRIAIGWGMAKRIEVSTPADSDNE